MSEKETVENNDNRHSIAHTIWEKTGFSFWEDYSQFFTGKDVEFNWLEFTFLHFIAEWDKIANEFVVEVGILGLNLRWQLPLNKWITTKQNEDLMKTLDELQQQDQ